MKKIAKQNFSYRKNMSIGEADAESDKQFLEECFIDIGDYEILEDPSTPQSIILGRTGIGKSALLEKLETEKEKTIRIEPEELALKYISNSTILNFFEDLGVNLSIFYTLLWQHTLVVELIKYNYGIDSPETSKSFFESIGDLIAGDKKKREALAYIEEWGDKFWADTETRIVDFTEKLEANLKSSIETNVPSVKLSNAGEISLSEQERSEVKYYGKKVVDSVQIAKLSRIIDLLAEDIFTNPQRKIFILIDRLDENWVEDKLRYKLIRALIETIKKFRRIEPVKIIVTLRTDLLNRVLDKTRDSGFQREKYNTLFLQVEWKKEQLKSLLDSRVNHLLKHKYTNGNVTFDDIFPDKFDKVTSSDYILDRTLLRPRDAILFVNLCLKEAQGKSEITPSIIKLAEQTYSLDRIDSLYYEWFVEHPMLKSYLNILHHKNSKFKVSVVTSEELEQLTLELVDEAKENIDDDIAVKTAKLYFSAEYPATDHLRKELLQCILFILYKIGVIGVKIDGTSSVKWIHDRTQDLTVKKIETTSIVYIHKLLWRALAIDKRP